MPVKAGGKKIQNEALAELGVSYYKRNTKRMKTGKETFKNHSGVLTLKLEVKCWYWRDQQKPKLFYIQCQPTEYTVFIIGNTVTGAWLTNFNSQSERKKCRKSAYQLQLYLKMKQRRIQDIKNIRYFFLEKFPYVFSGKKNHSGQLFSSQALQNIFF